MKRALVLLAVVLLGARPSDVPAHVPTAAYCCAGYGNDLVSPQQAAPYVSWAANPSAAGAAADRAAGIEHVYEYIDTFRIYRGDHAFATLSRLSASSVLAHNCHGESVATTRPGYLASPFAPGTLQLFDDELTYRYDPAYTAYFIDDVDDYKYGLQNGPPCVGEPPQMWREPDTARAYAALLRDARARVGGGTIAPPLIFNGLSDYAGVPELHAVPLVLFDVSNVIGGMCEGCLGDNSPDKLAGGAEWRDDEDLELQTIRRRKIFWDYVRYIANQPAARLYTFASFMLTWHSRYTVYQTAYAPNAAGGLHVTPETGIVAREPRKQIESVDALRAEGGAYVREYRACYYRGRPLGGCAFIVNSDANASLPRPRLEGDYRHTVVLSGGMVLEGGTVSVEGPPLPERLAPLSAAIAVR